MQVKSIVVILLTFIKLPFVIKIFVSSVFEWLFYTGFTICKGDVKYVNYIPGGGGCGSGEI